MPVVESIAVGHFLRWQGHWLSNGHRISSIITSIVRVLDGSSIKINAARGSVPRSFVARSIATLAAKNPTRQGLTTSLRSAAADLQTRPCRLGFARRHDLRFRSAMLLSFAPLSAPAALRFASGREVMTALRAVMAFSLATLGVSAIAVPVNHASLGES